MILHYEVGDIVQLKKGHACGENEWKILRTGVDIKLECTNCNRQIWMKRIEFERRVRKIRENGKFISIIHHKRNNNLEK